MQSSSQESLFQGLEKEMIVTFNNIEFSNHLKNNTNNQKRKGFRVCFDQDLTKRLQSEHNVKCYLKCISNYFKCDDSYKYNSPYWSGFYKCVDETCLNRISACIKKNPSDNVMVQVAVRWQKFKTDHSEKVTKKQRIFGNERKLLGCELVANGTINVESKHIILNNLYSESKITNKSTLKMVKYDYKHQNLISRDVLVDCQATKTMFDDGLFMTYVTDSGCKVKGFLQEITQNPFGFILFSEIQVRIWLDVLNKNPVWYFDGTGGIFKNINNQSSPMWYSIVCHDPVTKSIIPVYEFVSTARDTITIVRYLTYLKMNLEQLLDDKKTPLKIAPIIVTDFSWALIHAVLKSFTQMSILQYLEFCFEIFYKDTKIEKLPTIIYLCATHFLKLIIKRVDIILKNKQDVYLRKTFIFCFSLLQNATTVDEFDKLLLNIYNLFNQPYRSISTIASSKFIHDSVIKRKLSAACTFTDQNETEDSKIDDLNQNIIQEQDSTIIKTDSPFKKHYQNQVKHFSKLIESKNNSKKPNKFCKPELFSIIIDYIHVMPLWSGIILKKIETVNKYEVFTRKTNNAVENWFNQLKHFILGTRRLMSSEICTKLYNRILSIYLSYYNDATSKSQFKSKKTIKNKHPQENWKSKQPQIKRVKGHYYGTNLRNEIDNFQEESEQIEHLIDLNDAFCFNDIEEQAISDISSVFFSHKELENSQCENMETEEVNEEREHVYFIKLINRMNGCYCNSVVQSLLSLGNPFIYNISAKNEFEEHLSQIVQIYQNKVKKEIDTFSLRTVVDKANENKLSSSKKYQSGEQQDAFFFFNDIFQDCLNDNLKDLFKFESTMMFECPNKNCKKYYKFKKNKNILISITRAFNDNNNDIRFPDMFNNKQNCILTDFICNLCNVKHNSILQKEHFDLKSNQYLVIRIEHTRYGLFLNVKINDFNADCVRIPGSDIIFQVQSAILFYPFDTNDAYSGGHYTSYVRCEKGWLDISDNSATVYNIFRPYLLNVVILFLKKKY